MKKAPDNQRLFVIGVGFEPTFYGPKPYVLPARRSDNKRCYDLNVPKVTYYMPQLSCGLTSKLV